MNGITIAGLDYDNLEEIQKVARIHENGPLDWIPGYEVDEVLVTDRAKFLRAAEDNETVSILTARNEAGEVVGFHWLQLVEKYGRSCARIDSLWVAEDYRRMGIAQSLKARGEVWAKQAGVTMMITEVFYVNKEMVDLNLKLGFEARQVEMSKKL